MKKIHLLFIIPLLITACQPKAKTDAAVAPAPTPAYPYTIKHPDYWSMDTSHANTMVALNAIKAYETMDTVLMKKCFADSVTFEYDGGKFKGTISQLIKMAASMNTPATKTKIDMKDWESVVSTDKKEEWVTLWYTQSGVDKKGKVDSIAYINDMQLKGGKIVKFDEYARHFTAAK